MDADNQVDIDKELSTIEARAKTRRRRSMLATLVPVALTGLAVLVFAYDIHKKRAELSALDAEKRALDDELAAKQGKLEKATNTGEELETKIGRLRNEKKDLEDYLRSLRTEAKVEGPESVVLGAEGAKVEGLTVVPHARVTKSQSGRALDVVFSLDVQEGQTGRIKNVVYELNPVYYFVKREMTGGVAPSFEATASVFACRSTVLVKLTLEDGARMDLDFDWCRAEGWPAPKQEAVLDPAEAPPGRPPPPHKTSPTEPPR